MKNLVNSHTLYGDNRMNHYLPFHELIILRATNDYDKKALGMMIHEVNRTQVSQEELLSDTLYYFTQTTNKISVA